MVVTPEFLVEFRKDFDEAMDALREKYDISISLGNITFEEEKGGIYTWRCLLHLL